MSGTIANATRSAYDLAFQVSPIILQGGIASSYLGGMLPIVALTGQLAALVRGATSPDAFFARYVPIPNGTFIQQTIGNYPFANQQVAANAVIRNPNVLSLLMMCPIKDDAGYLTKLPILTSYKASLDQHNLLGGTYNIATPGLIYTNGVMLGMTALDSGESKQQQVRFQLDFWFPLITQSQAQQALGNLMQTVTNGGAISGTPTWSSSASAGSVGTTGLPAAVTPIISTPLGLPQ